MLDRTCEQFVYIRPEVIAGTPASIQEMMNLHALNTNCCKRDAPEAHNLTAAEPALLLEGR